MTSSAARSFRHGVHPLEHKDATEHSPVARMPFADRYVLPLRQSAGAPSRPVVAIGERVERGQVVAEPQGFISSTLHSPVAGTVVAIGPRLHPNGTLVDAIEIQADPFATQRLERRSPIPWRDLSPDEFAAQIQRGGLVGMGGAAFPTHVKYKLPEGRVVDRLVVNGCECEPYLTTDHRVMVEQPERVVAGIRIAAERLGAKETVIGVELNKPDAIKALRAAIAAESGIRVAPLKVKYPQGAEKMLIEAIYGLEVPSGKLPLDLGIVVNN
ncbi:MAG TPA: RnfABCDGE type electron transport complex subunit C, partial [Thermoanaerobaculia bacterium]|nr:RnfABCDGE type electron transport complex subunit C [Thermoanaerobaculia bacterium]